MSHAGTARSSGSGAQGRAFPPTPAGRQRVVLITGMSGAGKPSALKALEDLGYEAVDNVPLSLVSRLVVPAEGNGPEPGRPVAIGIDVRTRDFGTEPFLAEVERLAADWNIEVRVVFLDCDTEELGRRYAATRHRHPLAADRPVADGISSERRVMTQLRERADLTIDTTGLGTGHLKRLLEGSFALESQPGLAVCITSFSYRRGLPRDADLVFDVRFLTNPFYDPALRPMCGLDAPVANYVTADEGFVPFFDSLSGLIGTLLPRYVAEGKSYLTIAIGCTGGRHRSVTVAERLAKWLGDRGQPAYIYHRELGDDGSPRDPAGERSLHP